jgi:hypothetical protein
VTPPTVTSWVVIRAINRPLSNKRDVLLGNTNQSEDNLCDEWIGKLAKDLSSLLVNERIHQSIGHFASERFESIDTSERKRLGQSCPEACVIRFITVDDDYIFRYVAFGYFCKHPWGERIWHQKKLYFVKKKHQVAI